MPYLCAFYVSNSIMESYQECMVGDDYAEIMELFADRVKAQCVKVHGEQEKVDVPREKITADRCIPTFQCGDIVGKVMAVKPEALRPEYRSAEHQLILVTGGNGARERSFLPSAFLFHRSCSPSSLSSMTFFPYSVKAYHAVRSKRLPLCSPCTRIPAFFSLPIPHFTMPLLR